MPTPEPKAAKSRLGIAITYIFLLYIAWTGAWLLWLFLNKSSVILPSQGAGFFYWTVMRVLLWLMPSVMLIRHSGKKLRDVLTLARVKSILIWGGGAGMILGLEIIVTKFIVGKELLSFSVSWSLLTAVIIAPIVEEITFRGAILDAFQTRMSFWPANVITGVLFAMAHFPGWYFQGVLKEKLVAGGLTILFLGCVFGFAARKSKSVSGGILTHMLNNFFNAL